VPEQKSRGKGHLINIVVNTLWNNKKINVPVEINTKIIDFEALLCHQLIKLPSQSTLRLIFQGREL
jgi:hypothetical protein